MERRRLISIVTPCYNEEANVAHHFERVCRAIEPLRERYDFEFIYTDNMSQDSTFTLLREMAGREDGVRAIRFSRNIGVNRAIFLGLMEARGDAAMLIQADLQDPPELIPEFVRGWEEGYDVVYGQILDRDEGMLMQGCRRLYYRIIAALADVAPPRNAGEFRIASRRALDAIRRYADEDLYLRGAITHIGFPQKPLPYHRMRRHDGRSSSGLLHLLGYAVNGVVSTSTVVPIRAVTVVGFVAAALGFLYGAANVVVKLLFPHIVPPGMASVLAIVSFFAGLQLLALGVIGEYIRKIYLQSLGRPLGFIQDRVGFPDEHAAVP